MPFIGGGLSMTGIFQHISDGNSHLPESGALIIRRQNQTDVIEQLAAQRQLYWEAKRVDTLRMTIALGLALASFAFPYIWVTGTSWLRASTGLWLITDIIILRGLSRDLHCCAALIQEEFDTSVLMLPWNKIATGEKAIHEYIANASRRFIARNSDLEQLKNWYPDVSCLCLPLARLVCQRTNIVWDAQLRRRYSTIILVVTVALVAATFIYALIVGSTLLDYLLTFLPAMPAVVLGVETVNGHRAAAARLEELQVMVHDFWKEALAGTLADKDWTTKSRLLQDQIFISRKSNPLVPEIIYRYLRDRYEAASWDAADCLIKEVMIATNQSNAE
jgi:hypothetical protein